jgi:hypothetical protein
MYDPGAGPSPSNFFTNFCSEPITGILPFSIT